MKKKVPIKKIILTIFFICMVIWLIKNKDFGISSDKFVGKKTTTYQKEVTDASKPLTPEAEAPEPKQADPEQWTQTHSTSGPNGTIRDWFIPATTSNTTDWFRMVGCNTGFRAWGNDCLVEYKSGSSGDTTTVYLNVAKNIFYKAPNGIISDKQYSEEEFMTVRKDAESVRFREINSKRLNIKAWRTE